MKVEYYVRESEAEVGREVTREEFLNASAHVRSWSTEHGEGLDGGPMALGVDDYGWTYYALYETEEDAEADGV
jgi:hypothetical protein